MLEQLLIFTRGGLILWTCKEISNALKGSPIETLIKSCLLEERSADASFNYDVSGGGGYTLKWTFSNDLGLVFVAVFQRIFHLLYVDDLLAAVRREFSQIYDPKRTNYEEFGEIFRQLEKEAEARGEEMRKLKQGGKNSNPQSKKGNGQKTGSELKKKGGASNNNNSEKDDSDGDKGPRVANGKSNGQANGIKVSRSLPDVVSKGKENSQMNGDPDLGAFNVDKLQKKMRAKGGKKQADSGNINIFGSGKKGAKVAAEPKKAVKKNRVWDDSPKEDAKVDFSDPVSEGGDQVQDVVAVDQGESMMDMEEDLSSESEEDEEVETAKPSAKKKGWFSLMFQRYIIPSVT